MIPLIVFGTGGNSVEIVETVRAINAASRSGPLYTCVGFLDDDQSRRGQSSHGLPILGPIALAQELAGQFVNGIGGPGNFWLRPAITAKAGVPIERFETLVHPAASVASTARLGRGVVVFPQAAVGSFAEVGDHVLVLPNAVVSHDVTVGAHTCITAGVCISSRVAIGDSCYLGTRSCIIGSVSIGDRALVGMGSVVLRDVPGEAVVAGSPAKFLRPVMVSSQDGVRC